MGTFSQLVPRIELFFFLSFYSVPFIPFCCPSLSFFFFFFFSLSASSSWSETYLSVPDRYIRLSTYGESFHTSRFDAVSIEQQPLNTYLLPWLPLSYVQPSLASILPSLLIVVPPRYPASIQPYPSYIHSHTR